MQNQEIQVTEFNYTEELLTSYFNSDNRNIYVNCTNPLCDNPRCLVDIDVTQFRCKGKETTGRDCMRLFKITLIRSIFS